MNNKKEVVKCSECGKFFNVEYGMCPFCRTELVDNIVEETDNQDTALPATDTEESFAEDDVQNNFVLCPNCNNYYDENVGLCAFCGYSALELEDPVVEESNITQEDDNNSETTFDKIQNAYNSAYGDTEESKTINYKKIGIISAVVICAIIILSVILSSPKKTGVSMNQIENDIFSLEYLEDYFYSEFTYYDYNSIELDDLNVSKRQTNFDDKEDIIFCDVSLNDEYFNVTFTIKMNYIYYDEGGWILEDTSITNKIKRPIAAPEELSVILASIGDLNENKSKKLSSSTNLYAHSVENENIAGSLKGYTIEVLGYDYDAEQQIASLNVHTYNKFNDIYGTIILQYFTENGDWGWKHISSNEPDSSANVTIDSITSDFSSLIGSYVRYVNDNMEHSYINIKEIYTQTGEADLGYNRNYNFNIIETFLKPKGAMLGGYQYIEATDEWDDTYYKNVFYRRVN